MSCKTTFICLKSSFLAGCLLMLQTALAQYNWTELDTLLKANQKKIKRCWVMT
jgi:hypothetical protein